MMKKYKNVILYIVFGIATTLTNVIAYALCTQLLHLDVILSTCISWFIAVLFAYVTNKKWVFESDAYKKKDILKEISSFFACRLLTGLLDVFIMYVFVERLHFNDMIIKILSNFLVIVINYIASKLIIFNKEKKEKYDWKEILAICFIFGMALLFSMNSPLNIFKQGVSGTDSSVFRLAGLMMFKGYTPYLDFFDHKGPIIYIINYLGYIIDEQSGIWFVELGFLFFSFLCIYKIARMQVNSIPALFVLFFSIINLFKYFEQGNLVEEYAMLFILISLYIFAEYFLTNNTSKFKIGVCGACFGSVCLLRINMIPCWIVFCVAILLKCIYEKEYKKIFSYLTYFLLGCMIIVIPIFVWLISKGAFGAFIEDYFIFNMKYISTSTEDKWNTLFFFLNDLMIILVIAITCLAVVKEKKKVLYLSNLCFIILTLIMMSLSGQTYRHYGMILIPTFIFPIAYAFKILFNKKENEVSFLIVIYLMSNIVLPSWISLIQNTGIILKYSSNKQSYLSNEILEIKNIIETNSNESDTITVFGNRDYIYIISHRMPTSKYSYQLPIGRVNPKIMEEYFEELNKNNPQIVVTEQGLKDETLQKFIMTNHYEQIICQNENVLIYKKI